MTTTPLLTLSIHEDLTFEGTEIAFHPDLFKNLNPSPNINTATTTNSTATSTTTSSSDGIVPGGIISTTSSSSPFSNFAAPRINSTFNIYGSNYHSTTSTAPACPIAINTRPHRRSEPSAGITIGDLVEIRVWDLKQQQQQNHFNSDHGVSCSTTSTTTTTTTTSRQQSQPPPRPQHSRHLSLDSSTGGSNSAHNVGNHRLSLSNPGAVTTETIPPNNKNTTTTTDSLNNHDDDNDNPRKNDPIDILKQTHDLRKTFVMRVGDHSLTTIKGSARTQISILRCVADLFHLSSFDSVTITKIPRKKRADAIRSNRADFVTLTIKDQFISRGEMFHFQKAFGGKWMYEGERLSTPDGVRATAKEIRRGDHLVASGFVTSDTKITFRSRSARIIWLVQMSMEMWDYTCPYKSGAGGDDDGCSDIYFDKFVKFMYTLFEKWKQLEVTHSLTVVFFSRSYLTYSRGQMNRSHFPNADRHSDKSAIYVDVDGRHYEDHYKMIIENETRLDWDTIITQIKKEFLRYPFDVGWTPHYTTPLSSPPSDTSPLSRTPSIASQGNILEAINVTLNLLKSHYLDRDLHRTGNSLVIVSPGCGVFEVDKGLAGMTKQRMMDYGIGSDMLSLSLPPLHIAPFFLYKRAGTDGHDNVDVWKTYFEIPHWMHLSFISYDEDGTTIPPPHPPPSSSSSSSGNGDATIPTPQQQNPVDRTRQQQRNLISGRDFTDILEACRPVHRGDFAKLPSPLASLLRRRRRCNNNNNRRHHHQYHHPTTNDEDIVVNTPLINDERNYAPYDKNKGYREWGTMPPFDDVGFLNNSGRLSSMNPKGSASYQTLASMDSSGGGGGRMAAAGGTERTSSGTTTVLLSSTPATTTSAGGNVSLLQGSDSSGSQKSSPSSSFNSTYSYLLGRSAELKGSYFPSNGGAGGGGGTVVRAQIQPSISLEMMMGGGGVVGDETEMGPASAAVAAAAAAAVVRTSSPTKVMNRSEGSLSSMEDVVDDEWWFKSNTGSPHGAGGNVMVPVKEGGVEDELRRHMAEYDANAFQTIVTTATSAAAAVSSSAGGGGVKQQQPSDKLSPVVSRRKSISRISSTEQFTNPSSSTILNDKLSRSHHSSRPNSSSTFSHTSSTAHLPTTAGGIGAALVKFNMSQGAGAGSVENFAGGGGIGPASTALSKRIASDGNIRAAFMAQMMLSSQSSQHQSNSVPMSPPKIYWPPAGATPMGGGQSPDPFYTMAPPPHLATAAASGGPYYMYGAANNMTNPGLAIEDMVLSQSPGRDDVMMRGGVGAGRISSSWGLQQGQYHPATGRSVSHGSSGRGDGGMSRSEHHQYHHQKQQQQNQQQHHHHHHHHRISSKQQRNTNQQQHNNRTTSTSSKKHSKSHRKKSKHRSSSSHHHHHSSSSFTNPPPPSYHTKHHRKPWVLNPFRQEDEHQILLKRTHNRRRWSHVFPSGEVEFKRHSGPLWNSLCQPAILPITIDVYPTPVELADYQFNHYPVTLDVMDDVYYNHHSELLMEMVMQRLIQDFQLVPLEVMRGSSSGESQLPVEKGTTTAAGVKGGMTVVRHGDTTTATTAACRKEERKSTRQSQQQQQQKQKQQSQPDKKNKKKSLQSSQHGDTTMGVTSNAQLSRRTETEKKYKLKASQHVDNRPLPRKRHGKPGISPLDTSSHLRSMSRLSSQRTTTTIPSSKKIDNKDASKDDDDNDEDEDDENRSTFTLSMGHKIHILKYDPTSNSIDVVQYTASFALNDAINTLSYSYMLWQSLPKKYTKMTQKFVKYGNAGYQWSYLDNLICGDPQKTLREGTRFRRVVFAVIPEHFTDSSKEQEYIHKFQRLLEYLSKQQKTKSKKMDIKIVSSADRRAAAATAAAHHPSSPSPEQVSTLPTPIPPPPGHATTPAVNTTLNNPPPQPPLPPPQRKSTVIGDDMRHFIIQLRKVGGREKFEWMDLVMDATFDTSRAYCIMIHWLVASGTKVDAQIQLLQRRCVQYGLRLVGMPYHLISDNPCLNPYRSPPLILIRDKNRSAMAESSLVDRFRFFRGNDRKVNPEHLEGIDDFRFPTNRRGKMTKSVVARNYIHHSGCVFVKVLQDEKGWTAFIFFENRRLKEVMTVKEIWKELGEFFLATRAMSPPPTAEVVAGVGVEVGGEGESGGG